MPGSARGRAGIVAFVGASVCCALPAGASAGNDPVTHIDATYVSTYGGLPPGPAGGPVSVACPDDTEVVSGGFDSSSDFGELYLATSAPTESAPGVFDGWVSTYEGTALDATSYTNRAVCIAEENPRNSETAAKVAAQTRESLSVKCPSTRHVYGGGADGEPGTFVASSYPIDSRKDRDRKPDDGWKISMDNRNGSGKANVSAWVSCGKLMPTYEKQSETTVATGRESLSITCPGPAPGVIGGGQKVTGGWGSTRIEQSMASDYSVFNTYTVQMDDVTSGGQTLTAYAICLFPDFGPPG